MHLSVDKEETTLTLTSYSGSILRHLVFELTISGITSLKGIVGDRWISRAPTKVFMKGHYIFTYMKSSLKDSIYVTDSVTNVSSTQILECSSCDIVISPDYQMALIWSISSRLFVYSIESSFLTLNSIFNDSVTNFRRFTETIPFSSDSQLAALETGHLNPIRIINLTNNEV